MQINGVNVPDANNRGRVFPYQESGPHFCGPAVVNGVLMVVKVWQNTVPSNGNPYFRMVFETLDENPHLVKE